jgi:hypothetical protein
MRYPDLSKMTPREQWKILHRRARVKARSYHVDVWHWQNLAKVGQAMRGPYPETPERALWDCVVTAHPESQGKYNASIRSLDLQKALQTILQMKGVPCTGADKINLELGFSGSLHEELACLVLNRFGMMNGFNSSFRPTYARQHEDKLRRIKSHLSAKGLLKFDRGNWVRAVVWPIAA